MTYTREQALNKLLIAINYLKEKYGLVIHLGAELEFYLITEENPDEIIENISNTTNLVIEKEKGKKQYETITGIFNNVIDFINEFEAMKTLLIYGAKKFNANITFSPKPNISDYGSAIHIHMHLTNSNDVNIFNNGEIIENKFLMNTIGGILEILNQSLYMLTWDNDEEFLRFQSGYMVPTNISWGKNNRTTAIRIPDRAPGHNRRIEFRVPSANACIVSTLLFLVIATLYGIKNKIIPLGCIYGNAHDECYNLQSLHKNVDDAKRDFNFPNIFKKIMTESA